MCPPLDDAPAEVAGFAVRIVTIYYCTMLTYIITVLFLLLMPNFIALVNYIAAGRLMAFSNLNVGCLRPDWLAKIFFLSDTFSFGIQVRGATAWAPRLVLARRGTSTLWRGSEEDSAESTVCVTAARTWTAAQTCGTGWWGVTTHVRCAGTPPRKRRASAAAC